MYIVCKVHDCQQTHPQHEVLFPTDLNASCSKCNEPLISPDGGIQISQNATVIPVAKPVSSHPSPYDKHPIRKGDLLVANDEGADFDLTRGRIYRAAEDQGVHTFGDCVMVEDDNQVTQAYCADYFDRYTGQIVEH